MSALDQASAAPPLPAAGSSFYTAMRILPRPQREGMYAVYAFCRAVDDIADEGGLRPARAAALEVWRSSIEGLYRGQPAPLTAQIAPVVHRFGLREADFLAVIDGMAMDAAADLQGPDWATLDLYCDRVASAVGRLSVRIFGMAEEPGLLLSHHLGRALQLTNILRDVDEDAAIDRLYLPREALRAAGIDTTVPSLAVVDPRLPEACAPVVLRALDHFAKADAIMAGQPRAVVKAPRIMGSVYRMILDRIVARGFAPPRQRARVPKLRLVLTVARHGLF